MAEEQGIDVAWPQGSRYNWQQWKGRIGFGMAKVTEGTGIFDPDFAANWDAMWGLDRLMPRFGYHFFRAGQDVDLQAERFVSTVKAHGLLPGDNLVLDLEENREDGTNDGVAPAVVAERAEEFCHRVNALAPGHRILPYINPSFAAAGNAAGLEAWFLWVADYGVSRPAVPAPWKTWTFWQTGGTNLDTDVFNGTHAELLAFTHMPARR